MTGGAGDCSLLLLFPMSLSLATVETEDWPVLKCTAVLKYLRLQKRKNYIYKIDQYKSWSTFFVHLYLVVLCEDILPEHVCNRNWIFCVPNIAVSSPVLWLQSPNICSKLRLLCMELLHAHVSSFLVFFLF